MPTVHKKNGGRFSPRAWFMKKLRYASFNFIWITASPTGGASIFTRYNCPASESPPRGNFSEKNEC